MFSNLIYTKLVESRKLLKESWNSNSGLTLYRHHIKPRHAGGTDEEYNFTYLTHEEHIIAHYLLWRIYKMPGDKRAYQMMRGIHSPFINHSKEVCKKISESHKGVSLSEDHRIKISEGQVGRIGGFTGKTHSEETRKRMSKWQKGKSKSKEMREKLSIAKKGKPGNRTKGMSGKTHSEETRKKMKESWIRRKAELNTHI